VPLEQIDRRNLLITRELQMEVLMMA
jgi:hypothetical protein